MGNLADFKPADEKGADCIPAGDYKLVINKCDMKPSSNGDYIQVSLETQVMAGEFQNRVIFETLAYKWNKPGTPPQNAKTAVNIGRGKFAKICQAVGLPEPDDTRQLVGKTFLGKVTIQKGKESFPDKNVIAKASPMTSGGPVSAVEAAGKPSWN